MKNPWPGSAVTLSRNGAGATEIAGEVLEFETDKGETCLLLPQGAKPGGVRMRVPRDAR